MFVTAKSFAKSALLALVVTASSNVKTKDFVPAVTDPPVNPGATASIIISPSGSPCSEVVTVAPEAASVNVAGLFALSTIVPPVEFFSALILLYFRSATSSPD